MEYQYYDSLGFLANAPKNLIMPVGSTVRVFSKDYTVTGHFAEENRIITFILED